jgi:hypothetical protein
VAPAGPTPSTPGSTGYQTQPITGKGLLMNTTINIKAYEHGMNVSLTTPCETVSLSCLQGESISIDHTGKTTSGSGLEPPYLITLCRAWDTTSWQLHGYPLVVGLEPWDCS